MDNKGGFSGFIKDAAKLVISGPQRVEQPQPVKRPIKNIWGDTKSYIRKDDALRFYAKKQRYITGLDGRKIKLDEDQRKEVIEDIFKGKDKLTRQEALKNIRIGHKEAKIDRARGILPSEAKQTRLEEEFMDVLKPGPRVVKPGFGRGLLNTARIVMGKDPIVEKPSEPLDSSVINQNIPKIK
ncbi:MAG: hypothetical protein WC309_00380 [Candidatus Paceibacterota bacterium]|jgi:hypothetical protein